MVASGQQPSPQRPCCRGAGPYAQASAFRTDVEASHLAALDREPEFAERIRAARREVRFAGGGVPNFFRKPFGPGWALVGDAGYTKDPVTARGISDAFRSAELCAAALDETFDRWARVRRRDVRLPADA